MAFDGDDSCFHALLEMKHAPGSPPDRLFAGSVVNAWTFAADAEAAAQLMREHAKPRFHASEVVAIKIVLADPRSISEDESPEQLRERFQRELVVFATPIGWPRKRWWQFWRRAS